MPSENPEDFSILKSPKDTREYQVIRLDNDLLALVISDSSTERAAASMNVRVGSFSDPKNLPGLAHFLEHMLFLGTKKYPSEGFFENFLQKYGGKSNAYTDFENTNYHYEVDQAHFIESLEKFSTFFKCPLLRKESSEREIKAIHSEYEMNLSSDVYRIEILVRKLNAPDLPLSCFSVGNEDTLIKEPELKKIDPFEELKKFYETHYSSNIMTLCILGKEPVEELIKAVEENFSGITKKENVIPKFDFFPLKKGNFNRKILVQSIKPRDELYMYWDTPSTYPHYKQKPIYLIMHLIGHEGSGSLYSKLKNEGLSTGLSCFPFISCSGITIIGVNIKMTKKGKKNISTIIEYFFEYVLMLRRMNKKQWQMYFEELKTIENTLFVYKNKERPYQYCRTISENMNIYDICDTLRGAYFLGNFSYEKIVVFLTCINVESFQYIVLSNKTGGVTLDQIEKYYGTRYAYHYIKNNFFRKLERLELTDRFSPPKKNIFIAKDLSILSLENPELKEKHPVLIKSTDFYECFFKQDANSLKPLSYLKLNIKDPSLYLTPSRSVLTRIMLKYFNLVTEEVFYDANLAGIEINTEYKGDSISIELSGYNEILPKILDILLEKIENRNINENIFILALESITKSVKGNKLDKTFKKVDRCFKHLIQDKYWTPKMLHQSIKGIKFEDFKHFCSNLFTKSFANIYVTGNFHKACGLEICDRYERFLGNLEIGALERGKFENRSCLRMNVDSNHYFGTQNENFKDPNTSTMVSYQLGEFTKDLYVKSLILDQFTNEFFFNELRTKLNLGYYISSWATDSYNAVWFKVLVMGENHSSFVLEKIDAVIAKAFEKIKNADEKIFEEYRESVVNNISKCFINLEEESAFYWEEIVKGRYSFDRKKTLAEAAKNVSLESFITFTAQQLFKRPKRVVVSVFSKDAKNKTDCNENLKTITSVGDFRENGLFIRSNTHLSFHHSTKTRLEKKSEDSNGVSEGERGGKEAGSMDGENLVVALPEIKLKPIPVNSHKEKKKTKIKNQTRKWTNRMKKMMSKTPLVTSTIKEGRDEEIQATNKGLTPKMRRKKLKSFSFTGEVTGHEEGRGTKEKKQKRRHRKMVRRDKNNQQPSKTSAEGALGAEGELGAEAVAEIAEKTETRG